MSDYYEKIEYNEYLDLLINSISMSNSRIDKLRRLLPMFDISISKESDYRTLRNVSLGIIDKKKFTKQSLRLTELVDEWFIVGLLLYGENSQYKCDQFDGVLELLKDKKIIK